MPIQRPGERGGGQGAATVTETKPKLQKPSLYRVLILNEGGISQYSTPREIISSPSNSFVKQFILNQLEIKRNNILSLFEGSYA